MPAELQGMDQLIRRLRETVQDAQKFEEKALKKGAEVIREKAIELAPKKTGLLQANIVMSEVKNNQIEVGPAHEGFYGVFLELGTSKISPQPFMGPALSSNKQQIENAMREEIERGLGL